MNYNQTKSLSELFYEEDEIIREKNLYAIKKKPQHHLQHFSSHTNRVSKDGFIQAKG